jgi:hypothetical protein
LLDHPGIADVGPEVTTARPATRVKKSAIPIILIDVIVDLRSEEPEPYTRLRERGVTLPAAYANE